MVIRIKLSLDTLVKFAGTTGAMRGIPFRILYTENKTFCLTNFGDTLTVFYSDQLPPKNMRNTT